MPLALSLPPIKIINNPWAHQTTPGMLQAAIGQLSVQLPSTCEACQLLLQPLLVAIHLDHVTSQHKPGQSDTSKRKGTLQGMENSMEKMIHQQASRLEPCCCMKVQLQTEKPMLITVSHFNTECHIYKNSTGIEPCTAFAATRLSAPPLRVYVLSTLLQVKHTGPGTRVASAGRLPAETIPR